MTISIFELDKKIIFEKINRIPDGIGGFTKKYEVLFETWGRIEMFSSKFSKVYKVKKRKVSHCITIRKNSKLNHNLRLLCDKKEYEIVWIHNKKTNYQEYNQLFVNEYYSKS